MTSKFLTDDVLYENGGLNDDVVIQTVKEKWITSRKHGLKISNFSLEDLIHNINNRLGHDGIDSQFLKRASAQS